MAGVFNRLAERISRHPNAGAQTAPPFVSPAAAIARVVDPQQTEAALALSRDVLHTLEQFVISTPDLDTQRFLQRMRGTAAGLTAKADVPTLQLYREWVKSAVGVFAGLQRKYVAGREEEMWRLLGAYAGTSGARQSRDSEVLDLLRQSLQRMSDATRLEDIRLARQTLEEELRQQQKLVEQKAREDKERVATLARQVARLEANLAALRGQADFDVLTGIYHRGVFDVRLQEFLDLGRPGSLAILDVDEFKTINDTLGHLVGDRLLALVAEQLRRLARTGDLIARYGGDEFCFLAPDLTPDQLATRLAGAVARRHVRLEMEDHAWSVLLSVSVGVAMALAGETPEALVGRADAALFSVKRGKKGGIRLAG